MTESSGRISPDLNCPCDGGDWVNGSTRVTAKVLQAQARRNALLEVRELVAGHAMREGSPAVSLKCHQISTEINALIDAVLPPNMAVTGA